MSLFLTGWQMGRKKVFSARSVEPILRLISHGAQPIDLVNFQMISTPLWCHNLLGQPPQLLNIQRIVVGKQRRNTYVNQEVEE